MKKTITQETTRRTSLLANELDGVENKVPYIQKTVVNFKGRKSSEIAQRAIEILSDPDDLIFDPFMGSGTFINAAVNVGRKIVGTEIDNYTYYAVYTLFHNIDELKLKELYESVERKVKASVMSLYETKCCGTKNFISKMLFDPETQEYKAPTPNREIIDGNNIKLVSKCPICHNKHKRFDDFDYDKLVEVNSIDTTLFPKVEYIENSRINITRTTGADRYDRIFTNRNKAALLMIQSAISELEPTIERDVLEHALVSSLSLSRIAMYGSSTDILYHVVPYGAQEMNVWSLFEDKVNSFIEFKRINAKVLDDCPEFNDRYQMLNCSYQEYCKSTDQIFDLIYTDFPYTDQVPYLERNQLYRIWLETFYDKERFMLTDKMLDEEVVLTNAPSRGKKREIENYYKDIDEMFSCFSKVLKNHGRVVFTVKLGKNKYFSTLNEIINLARKNGFEYVSRIGIDKDDPTLRKQSAYINTLSKEMIVIFEKLSEEDRYWYVSNKNYEFETVKLIYNKVTNTSLGLNLSKVVQCVVEQLREVERYIATPDDIDRIKLIIQRNFVIDVDSSIVRIDPNKLYLDIEDKTDLFTKFYNYIPIIISSLLDRQGHFVLDDLYFEIANTLCTGNPAIINQFLDEPRHQRDIEILLNAYCTTDGKTYEQKVYTKQNVENSVDISVLSGTDFEILMKDMLQALGYTDVINTGGSGDLGVDLLAKKSDIHNNVQVYLFQCKRWAANVGSEPMQRLVAERARRGADVAVCITTSDYTDDGMKISREQNVGAWNGAYVIKQLEICFPGKYYNGMLAV